MEIANLNEISIGYIVYGHGNKNTIILISGFASEHRVWSAMVTDLAKQYKVIVFDNRGIGLTTDSGGEFDIEVMADDINQLLTYLNVSEVNIVGHSMGGMIAQKFAIKYSNLVKNMIIINSFSQTNKITEYALTNQNKMYEMELLSIKDLATLILPWLFSNEFLNNTQSVESFINGMVNNPTKQSVKNNKRQLNALIKADLRNELNQINCRTLVISSKQDLLAPFSQAKETHNLINGSLFVEIPGGHASPIEEPKLLLDNIINFLQT